MMIKRPFDSATASLGLEPLRPEEFSNEAQFQWMSRPRMPLWISKEPLLRQVILAVIRKRRTRFFYAERGRVGRMLTVSPDLVFQVKENGPVYVSGYCHECSKTRLFHFGRMLEAGVVN